MEKAESYKKQFKKEQLNIKNAFVIFRTMEGAARMRTAYSASKLTRGCNKLCHISGCDCVPKHEQKRFHKHWLKVERALEPDLINWEHAGLSKKQYCCRFIILLSASFCLLVVTFYVILQFKIHQRSLPEKFVECASFNDLTRYEAYRDQLEYSQDSSELSDKMSCYCKALYSGNQDFDEDFDISDSFENGE